MEYRINPKKALEIQLSKIIEERNKAKCRVGIIWRDVDFVECEKIINEYKKSIEKHNKIEKQIRFAEWTSFEGWYLKDMDLWENKIHPNLGLKTSLELYNLFEEHN